MLGYTLHVSCRREWNPVEAKLGSGPPDESSEAINKGY